MVSFKMCNQLAESIWHVVCMLTCLQLKYPNTNRSDLSSFADLTVQKRR